MASSKVLTSEVEPDILRRLERLGHEVIVLGDEVVVPPRADLLLVDPRARRGVEHIRLVRAFFPEMPVLCLSPVPEDAGFLGREPLVDLAQPYALEAALGAPV